MRTIFSRQGKLFAALIISLLILINPHCKKNDIKEEQTAIASSSKAQAESQKLPGLAEFVVDQSNIVLTHGFSYNIFLAPMGQQFTPSLYALDAIELQVEDASCSLSGSAGGNLKLNLREATITGKIIGTTEAAHFVNCFRGTTRFNFPSFVPLTPGQTYVIEAVHVSGHTSVLYMNESPDNYAGGDFIMNGTVRTGKDLWFREGLFNFIARTKDQVKKVGWQNLVRADGTRFKNQGDCMQYINTGR